MKARKIFNVVLIVFCFVSCQAKKSNDNVILTEFTKELIFLYINDIQNLSAKSRKDEIILTSVSDTAYYYLSVFANNSKDYKFCRDDFVGQIMCFGHLVRIFGDESSMFYSVNEKIKRQKRCKDNYTEYDPNVWRLVFYKDKSLKDMRIYETIRSESVSEIQNLAGKYFTVSQTKGNQVCQSYEVENAPKFIFGDDSLRKIISSNFKTHKEGSSGTVSLVVNIIVDEKGKAILDRIVRSSNDTDLDNEAIRVTKIICQYKFIPASHRGEVVKATYPVVFLRSDIKVRMR